MTDGFAKVSAVVGLEAPGQLGLAAGDATALSRELRNGGETDERERLAPRNEDDQQYRGGECGAAGRPPSVPGAQGRGPPGLDSCAEGPPGAPGGRTNVARGGPPCRLRAQSFPLGSRAAEAPLALGPRLQVPRRTRRPRVRTRRAPPPGPADPTRGRKLAVPALAAPRAPNTPGRDAAARRAGIAGGSRSARCAPRSRGTQSARRCCVCAVP